MREWFPRCVFGVSELFLDLWSANYHQLTAAGGRYHLHRSTVHYVYREFFLTGAISQGAHALIAVRLGKDLAVDENIGVEVKELALQGTPVCAPSDRRYREILGIFLLALSVFAIVTLYTQSPGWIGYTFALSCRGCSTTQLCCLAEPLVFVTECSRYAHSACQEDIGLCLAPGLCGYRLPSGLLQREHSLPEPP